MSDKVQKFVWYALQDLLTNGIDIQLEAKDYVDLDGIVSKGCFQRDPLLLACACKGNYSKWLPIFVHEWNHGRQYIEEFPLYKNLSVEDETILWKWADGLVELSKEKVNSLIKTLRDIELDCELRTIETIKRFQLESEIELNWYTRTANAYLLFYNVFKKHKKWYVTPPYEVKEIIEMMPNNIITNFSAPHRLYESLVLDKCF